MPNRERKESQNRKVEINYFNLQTMQATKHIDRLQRDYGLKTKDVNGHNPAPVWDVLRFLVKNRTGPVQHKNGLPVVYVKIGPAQAATILQANLFNRNINRKHAKDISTLIAAQPKPNASIAGGDGLLQWRDHGDHIEITVEALLSNGQHRLQGVVNSGKPAYFTVQIGLPADSIYARDINIRKRVLFDNACIMADRNDEKLQKIIYRAKGKIRGILTALIKEKNGVPPSGRWFISTDIDPKDFNKMADKHSGPLTTVRDLFCQPGLAAEPGVVKVGPMLAFAKLLIIYPNRTGELIRGAQVLLGENTKHPKDATLSKYLRARLRKEFGKKGGNQTDTFRAYCETLFFVSEWMKAKNDVSIHNPKEYARLYYAMPNKFRLPK